MNELYGSRADQLPRWMAVVIRAPDDELHLLKWAGRPGVRLLTLQEHLRYEQASLQRFPQNPDGSIAWERVASDLVVRTGEATEAEVAEFLRDDGDLVVMWGTLTKPSVLLSSAMVLPRITDLLEADPLLWIYRPAQLLEFNYFQDTVTAARVPEPHLRSGRPLS